MISEKGSAPLNSLREFCTKYLKGAVSTIHILPFYPWTFDDGFSVVDYREVDQRYGNWEDVGKLAEEFDLMFDLVLNHCSSKSPWFKEWVSGVEPEETISCNRTKMPIYPASFGRGRPRFLPHIRHGAAKDSFGLPLVRTK